jgi:hypothetical protein
MADNNNNNDERELSIEELVQRMRAALAAADPEEDAVERMRGPRGDEVPLAVRVQYGMAAKAGLRATCKKCQTEGNLGFKCHGQYWMD